MVIGSLAPDLATCIDDWEYFSHTAIGSIVFCMPLGLLTLKLFHLLRRPVVLAFPNPHRDALLPLCEIDPPTVLTTISSLLIAIWAHITWDLFTHSHSWLLPHMPFMETTIGGYSVRSLFWAFSSLFGSVFVAGYYIRFVIGRRERIPRMAMSDLTTHMRWCGVALLPLIGAVPQALLDPYNPGDVSVRLSLRPLAMYYMGWAYVTMIVVGFILKTRGQAGKSGTVVSRG